MSSVYKRLIFSCYWFEGAKDNAANNMHFKCLKHYCHIFDEIIFCITVKDVKKYELIEECEKMAIEALSGVKTLTFKIYENDSYREARIFKEEISEKLNSNDGITLFAHNKGVSNIMDENKNYKSILEWIKGLYFFNCEFIDEIEIKLVEWNNPIAYGSFLEESNKINNTHHIWYAGTFFWLNCQKAFEYLQRYKTEMPKFYDKCYAENFCGNMFGYDTACSHYNILLKMGCDYYINCEPSIFECLMKENNDMQAWNNFKKSIE